MLKKDLFRRPNIELEDAGLIEYKWFFKLFFVL